ncbi:stress-response A/B barrel domain-containing protein HS1-like [Rhodamnia argentea]|uniref:Stress-response A/B barrel domain-containing protein HS1-like n=1 Tax=Rhodamnia argentea TaxID=178133 RepID=A0A8B8MYZ1_9MYRT|nr:stress-response A/B barrel domain-containing protein HS1-like [Rhodamnia argentea]
MEEEKGVVKRALLLKFKDEIAPDQIEQLVKGQSRLVDLIEPLKSFHWGRSVSIGNSPQGFTHIFEFVFESAEGIAEYTAHPAHVEFSNRYGPYIDDFVMIDYKPTIFRT